jgi:hypothetical protein
MLLVEIPVKIVGVFGTNFSMPIAAGELFRG